MSAGLRGEKSSGRTVMEGQRWEVTRGALCSSGGHWVTIEVPPSSATSPHS